MMLAGMVEIAQWLSTFTGQEHATVRYFFPLELERFLQKGGFTLIRLGAFPDFDREPSEETWNVLGVVQSIAGD